MLRPVSLSIQTLYADLLQQLQAVEVRPASITRQEVKGIVYLRAFYRAGKHARTLSLGPADSPDALARAEAMAREMILAKQRRSVVTSLGRVLPKPGRKVADVLAVIDDAGLFRPANGSRGLVMVGTAAFACYSAMLGRILPSAILATADVDFATAHLALAADADGDDAATTLEAILKRADPSFAGQLQLDSREPPSKFRSTDGFMVDILTPMRSRDDINPMVIKGLGAGAVPLQYLDWLITDAQQVAILTGSGLLVTVPDPGRYAVHKLIIASQPGRNRQKANKDLAQAASLIEAYAAIGESPLIAELIEDARSRGRKWREAIATSLAKIELPEDLMAQGLSEVAP
jgi:hypothetical protein